MLVASDDKTNRSPKKLLLKASSSDICPLWTSCPSFESAFALLLNISTKTVQKWERGENQPNGSSLKLLTIAKKDPKMLYVD